MNKAVIEREQQGTVERITELLKRDTFYIPKEVMKNEDVYDETKMMFGIIFTECLKEVSGSMNTAQTVTEMMWKKINSVSSSEIRYECFCSISKANVVKTELADLMKQVNISDCIIERRAE